MDNDGPGQSGRIAYMAESSLKRQDGICETGGREQLYRHSLLISATLGGEWLRRFTSRKVAGTHTRPDEPQNRSGRFGEDVNLLCLPGFNLG
jgi:hypothetical protein